MNTCNSYIEVKVIVLKNKKTRRAYQVIRTEVYYGSKY